MSDVEKPGAPNDPRSSPRSSPRSRQSPDAAPDAGARPIEPPSAALRGLLDDVASEAPPGIDWARFEQRLEAALDAEVDARRSRPDASVASVASVAQTSRWRSRRLALGLGVGIAAAAALVGLSLRGSLSSRPSVPEARLPAPPPVGAAGGEVASRGPGPAPTAPAPREALAAGSVLEAGAGDVTASLGFARVTLRRGGRARIQSLEGDRAVLTLERGRLDAEVDPPAGGAPREPRNDAPSRFVVEAGDTRVAVRGTIFSVERQAEQVLVEVRRGAVSVGPREGRRNAELLLQGPTRAAFTPGGAISPPPAPGPSTARSPAPDGADAGGLEAPSSAAPLLTSASVRAALEQCVAKIFDRRSGPVRLRVASTFTVRLRPDGSVLSARLDPPLAPDFQACAGTAIAGRFAPGTADFSVPVAFDSGER